MNAWILLLTCKAASWKFNWCSRFCLFCSRMWTVRFVDDTNWLTDDLWSSFYPFLTEAIDKGDNRRLGKKPLFTSAQVILPSRRAFIWFIYALVLIQKPDNDQVLCDFILHALGMMIRVSDDSLRPSEATCPALTAEIQCRISSRAPRYRCTACQTGEAKRSLVKWSHAVKTRT